MSLLQWITGTFPYSCSPMLRILRTPIVLNGRHFATAVSGNTLSRAPKGEGSIQDIFTSLGGTGSTDLPPRFAQLKKDLWNDGLEQSWRELLVELKEMTEEVAVKGDQLIPRITYNDIKRGLSEKQVSEIKKTGVVVVSGAISAEQALEWKRTIREYIAANSKRVKGFPPNDIQVYELYNTPTQIEARTHPAMLETQKALLNLWHTNSDPNAAISLTTPISYFDRLRIRQPGDASFTLGPHVDHGGVEKWEDEAYRKFFSKILTGGAQWRDHDAFDAALRIHVKSDLYNTKNQCSIFRPFQGWTALSQTGPNEGTLKVLPYLNLSTAYIMLRPFFRLRSGAKPSSLESEDWVRDTESSAFPGAVLGCTQELDDTTHPHLRLSQSLVPMPTVQPGDQVFWHCDTVHAVETQHRGTRDSSVLYIPAVPLTLHNADYLRDQRITFECGIPSPDFPGGEGESQFVGRAKGEDVTSSAARLVLGLEPFPNPSHSEFIEQANKILFR